VTGVLTCALPISPEAVQALLAADSLGRHFNQVFKPCQFPYRRLR